jgi:hypothetical protein
MTPARRHPSPALVGNRQLDWGQMRYDINVRMNTEWHKYATFSCPSSPTGSSLLCQRARSGSAGGQSAWQCQLKTLVPSTSLRGASPGADHPGYRFDASGWAALTGSLSLASASGLLTMSSQSGPAGSLRRLEQARAVSHRTTQHLHHTQTHRQVDAVPNAEVFAVADAVVGLSAERGSPPQGHGFSGCGQPFGPPARLGQPDGRVVHRPRQRPG